MILLPQQQYWTMQYCFKITDSQRADLHNEELQAQADCSTVKANWAWLRNITSHSCSLQVAVFIWLCKPRYCLRWWCKVWILNLKMRQPKIENSSEENACFSLTWLLFCSVLYGIQICVCKVLWSSDLKHLGCTVNSYISFDPNNFFDM